MDSKIVPMLYFNAQHSEVSTPMFLAASAKGGAYDQMLQMHEAHNIPFTFSGHAVDIALLAKRNPNLIEKMNESPLVTFTKGPFSHALPTFHPEQIESQFAAAKKITTANGIETVSVGMMPEFDVHPGSFKAMQNAGMSSVLLQEGVNAGQYLQASDRGGFMTTGVALQPGKGEYSLSPNLWLLPNTQNFGYSMNGIMSQGPALRNVFLGALRGVQTPAAVTEQFAVEAKKYAAVGATHMPFLTDVESVLINDGLIEYDAMLSELAKYRNGGDLSFGDFTSIDMTDTQPALLEERPKQKWDVKKDPSKTYDLVSGYNMQELSQREQGLVMLASVADLYSAQFGINKGQDNRNGNIVSLPKIVNGQEVANAVNIRSDERRPYEIGHIVSALQHGRTLTEFSDSNLDAASQEFMSDLESVLKTYF